MKCRHIFENRIYLITNKAVMGNTLFRSADDQEEFRQKVEIYLGRVCKIIGQALHRDQFQLLIETKSREEFIKFYERKHKNKIIEQSFIPLSTHIFSRQMSNLQVSIAKRFNFKNQRSGSLFSGRFDRILIENEADLENWVERLSQKKRYFSDSQKWLERIKDDAVVSVCSMVGYAKMFGRLDVKYGLASISTNQNLGGCFEGHLKIDHLAPFLRQMMIEYRKKYPCDPNYN